MAEFPSFPLWVQRYMADTSHLTYEEHGIYLNILMVMWLNPFQRLPNDDEWLSRRFRIPPEKLRPLIKEFCQCDGNWISQKCLQKEWERVKIITRKRREAAKIRWELEKDPFTCNAGVQSTCNAPIPIPIPTKKEKKVSISANCVCPDTWEPSDRHYKTGSKRGLSIEKVNEMASDMREWSLSGGKKKADWNIFFNIWMKNNYSGVTPNGNGHGPKRSGPSGVRSAIYETLDRAIEATGGHKLRPHEGEGTNGPSKAVGKSGPGSISSWPSGSLVALPKAGD